MGVGLFRGLNHLFRIGLHRQAGNVFGNGPVKQFHALRQIADMLTQHIGPYWSSVARRDEFYPPRGARHR